MKKFDTNGIENIEKPINESFGTLILGLLTIFGLTLSAAIRCCRNSYDQDPPITEPEADDLDNKKQKLPEGTHRTYEEVADVIDNELGDDNNDNKDDKEGEDKDKENNKKDDKKEEKEGVDKDGVRTDGNVPTQPPLSEQDPNATTTKAKADLIKILTAFNDALEDKEHRNKIELLFNYILNGGAAAKAQEDNKLIKNEKRSLDMDYVLSRSIVKFQQALLSKDKKYNDLFKDVNSMKGLQELICLNLIFNNEKQNTSIPDGMYKNIINMLNTK